jgi:hypothetical protein
MHGDGEKLKKRYPECHPEIYVEIMMNFARWGGGGYIILIRSTNMNDGYTCGTVRVAILTEILKIPTEHIDSRG